MDESWIKEWLNRKKDFHIHCNYNDHSAPDLTVHNAVRRAEQLGLEVIAFTEHVRRSSDWIDRYLKDIESTDTNVKVISGFEAKILLDGSVDCPKDYAKDFFLVASFHTSFGDKMSWVGALQGAIMNPAVDVIGHLAPEPLFSFETEEIIDLARLLIEHDKIIELNNKYHRPPLGWLEIFRKEGVKFHLGSDAHSLQEIGRFERISDLISIVEKSNSSSLV